jgi:hypothetical protein
VLADGAAKHEITNWLRRAGWSTNFAGRDLGEIHGSSRMPSPADSELRRLIGAIDSMFFDRCIGGLKTMPLMTRLLLASPHPTEAHSRPFGPLKEKTSMDRYLAYWKRLLCYCMNVLWLDEDELPKRHRVPVWSSSGAICRTRKGHRRTCRAKYSRCRPASRPSAYPATPLTVLCGTSSQSWVSTASPDN